MFGLVLWTHFMCPFRALEWGYGSLHISQLHSWKGMLRSGCLISLWKIWPQSWQKNIVKLWWILPLCRLSFYFSWKHFQEIKHWNTFTLFFARGLIMLMPMKFVSEPFVPFGTFKWFFRCVMFLFVMS